MATSNAISKQKISTQIVIDHAMRACRIAPQQITGEYLQTAQEQTQLMLSSWANTGTPLWCQTSSILPLQQGMYTMPTPPGTIDLLNYNIRSCNRFSGTYTSDEGIAAQAFDGDIYSACTHTTPGGFIALQLGSGTPMDNFGIMPNVTGIWSIDLQYSMDGITWTTFYTDPAFAAQAQVFQWVDFQGLRAAPYYRLLGGSTTVLDVAELFFGNNSQEVTLERINKDDYWSLPNKSFQGRPVQFWLDRQVDGPIMNLWPTPGAQYVFFQITVLAHRQIMDVGTLTQQLEVPQRVFDTVVWSLAERLRLIIPEVDKQATADIPDIAAQARRLMWAQEIDDSPINLNLDITAYTA